MGRYIEKKGYIPIFQHHPQKENGFILDTGVLFFDFPVRILRFFDCQITARFGHYLVFSSQSPNFLLAKRNTFYNALPVFLAFSITMIIYRAITVQPVQIKNRKSLTHNEIRFYLVQKTGLEPVRTLLPTGF